MLSEHDLKWGELGRGNTKTRQFWVLASICEIVGREKRRVRNGEELKDLAGMKWVCLDGPRYQGVTGQGNLDNQSMSYRHG